MKTKSNNSFTSRILWCACAIVFCFGLGSAEYAIAQAKAKRATSPAKEKGQKRFASSQEAAAALIDAAEKFDVPVLLEIVGPGGEGLVETADPVQDKQRATTFVAKAREKTLVTLDPKNPNRAIVSVGNEEWPYPVPIVKRGGRWSFNAPAGRQEILNRRIGANELDAIAICRCYVEVQKE